MKIAFAVGHAVHEAIEKELCNSDIGGSFAAEVPLIDETNRLKGTTDGIYKTEEGEPIILEFKTANSRSFVQYTSSPDPKHVRQVHCYMHMTGAKQAHIIYVEKSSHETHEHIVMFDHDLMDSIIDTIHYIRKKIAY